MPVPRVTSLLGVRGGVKKGFFSVSETLGPVPKEVPLKAAAASSLTGFGRLTGVSACCSGSHFGDSTFSLSRSSSKRLV